MILSRACRALLLFVLAVGLLGVKRGAAQEVRITAEWVKENPGRLQTSGGSAFNGRNDYFFRLRVPTPREFEVVSLLIPKKSEYRTPVYQTRSGAIGPATVVKFGFSENQPYEFDVDFHIYEMIELKQADGTTEKSPKLAYVARLSELLDAEIPPIE